MIFPEARYFNLNKILLQATGLWPYQQTKLVQVQFSVFVGILVTAIIFQLTTFMTSKCTPKYIIKVLSTVITFIISLIKYVSFRFHIKTIKKLLTQLQYISNELKEKNEIAIMKKYGWNARCYAIVLTLILVFFMSALLLEQFWSSILNIILCKNISQSHHMHIKMEYFLDQKKYFYFILFHINIAIFIELTAVLAIGAMFIAYFQYICGMFMIASYRIKNAMEIDTFKNIYLKNENLILINIIRAINMHRQAMKLCDLLIFKFEKLFICLIAFGVICLTFNLFQIFQISSFGDITEFLSSILFVIGCIIYMFLANHVGQDITDHNNYIYVTAYNVQWYKTTLHIQKIILFVLQRGVKTFTLTIGGLFDASFEGFAMLVKASVSYFTVIYSTR